MEAFFKVCIEFVTILFLFFFFFLFVVNFVHCKSLFNSPEPMDENCYEQMKARPDRSVNKLQDAPPSQVSFVFWIKGQIQPRSQHSCLFQERKGSTFW